ncbi:MAG: PilZ domain-containing protein [Alphaproteobacteria bacterium]|nr:MAG: PilZ domain-containing protein [Alphaproteobacteria bacterium]
MMTAAQSNTPSRADRRRTLKTGLVFVEEGADPIKCSLVNWSSGGARLRFDPVYDGPDHFKLQIGFGQLVLATMDCLVCWRKGDELGVQFDENLPFDASF